MSCADLLLFDRRRRADTIAISSFMLDALMAKASSPMRTPEKKDESKSSQESLKVENTSSLTKDQKSTLIFTPIQVRVQRSDKEKYHSASRRRINRNKTSDRDSDVKSNMRPKSTPSSRNISYTETKSNSSTNTSSTDRSLETSINISMDQNSSIEESPARNSLSQSRSVSSKSFSSRASKSSGCTEDMEMDRDNNLKGSIYITPEGKPFSQRSSEGRDKRNSSVKRSFSDEHQDDSRSKNSTYTPESSPREHNSAKRMKIRWSDADVLGEDSPSYSRWRLNVSCSSEQGVQPELIGYQMVGDSQFCRFGQQLLGLQRVPMPNCPGRIGICVSGQTITDLHKRVRDNFYPISEKIILMIGTNDFLRNVNVSRMCEELSALIKTLQKSASTIILLTLPPIPKLAKKNAAHFELLDVYNKHIRSLENGKTVRIADISPLYMTCPPYQRCRMHLFELFFGGGERRHDLIHLNRLGLEVIRKYILDKFL